MVAVGHEDPAAEIECRSLASCLELCLHDVEERCAPSADLLKLAILHLRQKASRTGRPVSLEMHRPTAVISYLSYLLPDLDRTSPSAALAVRGALARLDRTAREDAGEPVFLH